MKRLRPSRLWIAIVIVVTMAVWPAVHAVVFNVLDFSTWMGGGFGMFAVPHPFLFQVSVLYVEESPETMALEEVARLVPVAWGEPLPLEVGVVREGGTELIDLQLLLERERREVLRRLIHTQMFRAEKDVAGLVAAVDTTMPPEDVSKDVLVFVSCPRVSLGRRTRYAEVRVFRLAADDRRIVELDTFRSDSAKHVQLAPSGS